MNNEQLVELFTHRDERALDESAKKYGSYCRCIADNILGSREDSEECVNDTYLKAWESIPPQQPDNLGGYLGRITRNLALNRYRRSRAKKRGGGETDVALDELAECVPSHEGIEKETDDAELGRMIGRFVSEMPEEARIIFLKRYWFLFSISEIARSMGAGESKVKSSLMRQRKRLKEFLESEGIDL